MSGKPFIIVAIDGGAAAGKSSTARSLSERFNLLHADTGSYYRAVTAEMLRRGASPGDLESVKAAISGMQLGTRVEGRTARIEISGRTPGDEIRSREVNDAVSHFAAIPELRAALLSYQRGQAEIARKAGFAGLVMEGRDIGSVIFPDADFRFFPPRRTARSASAAGSARARRTRWPSATGWTRRGRPPRSRSRPAPSTSTPPA
jgi:cytidylate kinase